MICIKQSQDSFRLIFQPDHARHTADLVRHWVRPTQIPQPLWDRLLIAVEHHDDGWHMHKYQPLIDEQGQVYSFLTLPVDTHVKYLQHCIKIMLKRDLYQGILIALHFRYIEMNAPVDNDKDRSLLDQFVAWTDSVIDRTIERLREEEPPEFHAAFTRPILKIARRILCINDSVSLMLIGALPWKRFEEPVCFGSSEVVVRYKSDEWGVRFDPWPYNVDSFSISVNSREISRTTFTSSEDFFEVMGRAPIYRIVHRIMPYT